MSQYTNCNFSKEDLHTVVSVAADLSTKNETGIEVPDTVEDFSPEDFPFETLRNAFLDAELVPPDRNELLEDFSLAFSRDEGEEMAELAGELAEIAALAGLIQPHLVFTGGQYECLEAGLADEIGLSTAEFMSANAGIALVNAQLDYAAPLIQTVSLVPNTAETASLLAVVLHHEFMIAPGTTVVIPWIGWIWRAIMLLWKLIKWISRAWKRLKAARRLRGLWKKSVNAGKMTKALYRKKLVGLIWKIKGEIAVVVGGMLETAAELKELYEAAKKEKDPEKKKALLEQAAEIEKKLEELKKMKEKLEAEKKAAEEDLKQNK